tara:strand:+ start:203 stop:454 length:252 start_codon:yes stop_codon:yes gene_type:complete
LVYFIGIILLGWGKEYLTPMRCIVCNTILSEEESVKKYELTHPLSGNFVDTCSECLDIIKECEQEYEENKKKRGIKPLKHSKY